VLFCGKLRFGRYRGLKFAGTVEFLMCRVSLNPNSAFYWICTKTMATRIVKPAPLERGESAISKNGKFFQNRSKIKHFLVINLHESLCFWGQRLVTLGSILNKNFSKSISKPIFWILQDFHNTKSFPKFSTRWLCIISQPWKWHIVAQSIFWQQKCFKYWMWVLLESYFYLPWFLLWECNMIVIKIVANYPVLPNKNM